MGVGLGVGADASWPLFCAHVLGALIEHAPAKTRLQLAADAHAGLKAAAAYASSSFVVLAQSSDIGGSGGGSSVAMSPAASVSTRSAADADASVSSREGEGEGEEIGVSTRKAAAFAVGAIYGRLETARRAATEVVAVGSTEMMVEEGASGVVAVSA